MLPATGILAVKLQYQELPTRTFRLHFDSKILSGMTDETEALMQAAYLIFGTERYQYEIYGWDYGIELLDLIGRPTDFVQSELKRRITDALTWDSRISGVEDFQFTVDGRRVGCVCTVRTIYGELPAEMAVEI